MTYDEEDSNVRALSEPIPFQMGLQVPRSVRAQTASENDVRAGAPATGCDLPRAGPAEGMPNYRGSLDAGPCAHVYRHSAKAPGGIGDRISQRKERNRRRSPERQRTQLYGRALLGPRLRSIDRRVRTGPGGCGFHAGQTPRDLLQQAVDLLPVRGRRD